MNCRLLKYRFFLRHTYAIFRISFFVSIGLFSILKWLVFGPLLLHLLPYFVSLISCFFGYINTVKYYRYKNKREIFFWIYSPMRDCQSSALLPILVGDFLPPAYIVTLAPFYPGLIFFQWSKEIRRAKEQGFEKCGNWQIRYVLGIILMLPFPVYAIYDILRALGLLWRETTPGIRYNVKSI